MPTVKANTPSTKGGVIRGTRRAARMHKNSSAVYRRIERWKESDAGTAIDKFRDHGWTFKYEPSTHFIGAYHEEGGKQSIMEVVHPYQRDEFGFAMERLLNKSS